MVRKIFDILPPDQVPPPDIRKPAREIKEEETGRPPKKTNKSSVWVLILLVLAIGGAIGFSISKAEIKIWPETETVFLKTKLRLDTEIGKADFVNGVIPGQFLNVKESLSESFLSSGRSSEKAEGVIRLYNAFSTKSENWLEGTRFVSSEGKLFKSKNKIAVPGAEIENGKMIPRYVDVPVVAAEAGEEYNIGPSNFSIFVFRGTPRYTKFYGESLNSMTGGGGSPQVTAKDIEDAKESIIVKTKIAAKESLEASVMDDFIFLDDILETEVEDVFALAKEGDNVESFNSRATVGAVTIIFKKEEVQNFVKDFVISKLQTPEDKGKILYENSLKIDYSAQVVDFESGKVTLSLNFSVKIYSDIDLDLLKKTLIGKSLTETKYLLESEPEFASVDVKFWPFWVRSVPGDLNKINLEYPIID